MTKLNEKEVLKYISDRQYVTVRDVQNHFKVSRLTAYIFLKVMAAKGLLLARKVGQTMVFEINTERLMP
jgi:DeoR/GlpR family transcriptional regulator of sugar metabolism